MAEIDFGKEENKQLLSRLYAFARGLYNQLYKDDPNWKGKGFKDYVYDAILKHLEGKDNYDPNKGRLEYHLKHHVIKQALTNDLPPHVKKAYAVHRKMNDEEKSMSQQTTVVEPAPIDPDDLAIVSIAINDIESGELLSEIESEINGDTIVEQIYLAIVYDKYQFSDRKEICHDFDISVDDFANGKRRLITILKRVFKKLDIKA